MWNQIPNSIFKSGAKCAIERYSLLVLQPFLKLSPVFETWDFLLRNWNRIELAFKNGQFLQPFLQLSPRIETQSPNHFWNSNCPELKLDHLTTFETQIARNWNSHKILHKQPLVNRTCRRVYVQWILVWLPCACLKLGWGRAIYRTVLDSVCFCSVGPVESHTSSHVLKCKWNERLLLGVACNADRWDDLTWEIRAAWQLSEDIHFLSPCNLFA
jgi:hypothetical protein